MNNLLIIIKKNIKTFLINLKFETTFIFQIFIFYNLIISMNFIFKLYKNKIFLYYFIVLWSNLKIIILEKNSIKKSLIIILFIE